MFYKILFSLDFLYNFFPPYNAPAAIKSDIPPSMGTHGGGQQPGPPVGGGGGGGPACKQVTAKTSNIKEYIYFAFIKSSIKVNKKC